MRAIRTERAYAAARGRTARAHLHLFDVVVAPPCPGRPTRAQVEEDGCTAGQGGAVRTALDLGAVGAAIGRTCRA